MHQILALHTLCVDFSFSKIVVTLFTVVTVQIRHVLIRNVTVGVINHGYFASRYLFVDHDQFRT